MKIRFDSAVHSDLAPVLMKYGFEIKDEQISRVLFLSAYVELAVYQNQYSYEINIEIRHKSQSEIFSLNDIIESQGGQGNILLQASTQSRVHQCIESLATLLEKYGKKFLSGDLKEFQRMSVFVRQRDEKVTQEIVNRPIREAAEHAWQGQDFKKFQELYESLLGEPTALERKRFEYAKSLTAK